MNGSQKQLMVAGVNYRKTALEVRNKFALTTENIRHIYEQRELGSPDDFFILSTCNRTEIYGICDDPQLLTDFLWQHSHADSAGLDNYMFTKTGNEAVQHLFQVAAGLDSQILGDYEIIGQLKNAFLMSKSHGRLSGYLEKLVNGSLQASRQVRNNTSISDGTTSVSYAVIQLLKKEARDITSGKLCLMGLGKIGTLTLKNLVTYSPNLGITLVNRNESKAETVAAQYSVNFAKNELQDEVVRQSDILIVATGADHPIIEKELIESSNIKLVFDLSVPSNVSPAVKEIPGLKFYDIDSLSGIVNETISQRKQQVPAALDIIEEHIEAFREWEKRRELFSVNK
jgi:glutamyl-tRNA reductase